MTEITEAPDLTTRNRLLDIACTVIGGKAADSANGRVRRQAEAIVTGFLEAIEILSPVMVKSAADALSARIAIAGNVDHADGIRHVWSEMVSTIRQNAPGS